jgi:hypothetical protein
MSLYALTATDAILRVADGAYIPNDPTNRDRMLYDAWVSAGNTPDPYVAAPVPLAPITQRQMRLTLLSAGLLTTVDAMITQRGGADKITWDYASSIDRNDTLILSMAGVLGLSASMVDAMFLSASKL